jgi:hypothetical protein
MLETAKWVYPDNHRNQSRHERAYHENIQMDPHRDYDCDPGDDQLQQTEQR